MEENGESINQYDNEDASMSIKAEPEVVFEIDESVNWTTGNYASENIDDNDESNQEMSKSDENDKNLKSPTLEQVIRKLDGLTKEMHHLKRILTHQNDMISNMIIAQNTSFRMDIKSMKESIKQQNNVISQVLPQQMGSLKKVLISHLQAPPIYTNLFPVKTQHKFDELENFINDENKSEIINAVKHIISPKGLRYNMDAILSKDILLHYNLDGTFNKRRLLSYKNVLDVLFLATYTDGRSFNGFVEELRHILRLVKNKHFKMICMEKKKLREETAIKNEPETRRRSRRTRFRNLRYRSPEHDQVEEIITPDDTNDTTKEYDDDFLLQEPSSSTSTKKLQPRVMLKRNRNPTIDSLEQVLKEIGLHAELYEFMKSRGITADALKYMKLRHIDELFKGTRLSTKIVFEHKLREWQNKHGICEVSTTQSTNFKTNTQSSVIKPQIETALNQLLSKTDTSTISNRLMEAIQQAVNAVLTNFKASCKQQPLEKHNDFAMECSEVIPIHEAINNNPIKCESLPKVNKDEVSLTQTVKKKVARRRESLPFENHDEPSIPQKIQKRVTEKKEKSPKPSTQIQDCNNTINESFTPKPKKRRYELGDSVEEILDMFPFGQRFKEEYRLGGILTPQQRTELVRTIVDFYIKNNQILTVRRCFEIAEEILKLFPTECMETYFSQPNKKLPPKGKIWDRYQGRKRYMRKVINIKSKPKLVKSDTISDTLDDTMDKANWSEMESLCSQMKTITNEKDLLAKWKESFAFRRYQLQSEWFSNWKLYFDEYPFVKQQNYGQFIDADLKTLYPNLKFNDFLWFEFLKNFKTFFLNRIKHPKSKQLFDNLFNMEDLDTTSDYLAIKIVELLHAVLKTHHKNFISIEDSQRTFTVEVTDLADLKKVVIERKKQCTDNNLQAKPYIAVVGHNRNYTHFSVILDSTGFSCDNYKDALVLCFNLYLFFDLSFPYEVLGVWLFIQKYFFNKPSLVNNPRVETFINDIKAQKQITLDIKQGVFEK